MFFTLVDTVSFKVHRIYAPSLAKAKSVMYRRIKLHSAEW